MYDLTTMAAYFTLFMSLKLQSLRAVNWASVRIFIWLRTGSRHSSTDTRTPPPPPPAR